jgi:hypothetical protein
MTPSSTSRSRYERFVEDILADVTAVDLANDPIFVIEHIRKAVAELRLLRSETATNKDAEDAARYRRIRFKAWLDSCVDDLVVNTPQAIESEFNAGYDAMIETEYPDPEVQRV